MIRYSAVAENRMMFDPEKGPVASGIQTQHQEELGRCLPGCKGRLRNSATTLSRPFLCNRLEELHQTMVFISFCYLDCFINGRWS